MWVHLLIGHVMIRKMLATTALAVFGVAGLAGTAHADVTGGIGGGVTGIYAPAATATRCPSAVTWSVTAVRSTQAAEIRAAVAIVAKVSGQRYVEVSASTPAALTITTITPAAWLYTGWEGYTWWTANQATMGLLDVAGQDLTVVTLHELMLSRHIVEVPDAGGLLGHTHAGNVTTYSAADDAMLAATPCL